MGLGSSYLPCVLNLVTRNVLGISSYVLIEWRNGQMRTRQFDTRTILVQVCFWMIKNIWLLAHEDSYRE